jgi:uncharacterized protein GlcG (DUF336 family)
MSETTDSIARRIGEFLSSQATAEEAGDRIRVTVTRSDGESFTFTVAEDASPSQVEDAAGQALVAHDLNARDSSAAWGESDDGGFDYNY